MVTKHTNSGRPYEVEDGKRIVWHASVDPSEGEEPFDIRIPLRMKVGVLRPLAGSDIDDISSVLIMLDALIPGQSDKLDEMDVNDLQEMFAAWQDEYTALNGASVGEASGSSI